MRDFGPPINEAKRAELLELIERAYSSVPAKREVTAADFAMDDMEPDRIVVKEVELRWDSERLRVGKTLADARPPFAWIYEVSSDVGEADYFKHYLVLEDEIVLAQRKVLTPIDGAEAEVLRHDLQAAVDAVAGS